jgi:acyl transferase domain-containing protein/NADPH:quinone reductase-like Zn-dependent oxidoreductase/NADP-dependent 3-hydroxy acid dehydrogenase YdfG/acyl carrier protein
MRKIAIVATSFRMPGTTPARFWEDLLAGRDLVTEVDPARWSSAAFLHPNKNHPGSTYTFAAGSIGDVSGFDAGFFAISPREAAQMDPQQRLLLEMSWEAFENAGIRPSTVRGSDCGVFIGVATTDYAWRMADDLAAIDSSFATGNTSSIAANRLSYFFDLRGPSMAIDTACSSSLVAFHQACRAIVSGEISQALAGAVSLHLHPLGFISFSKATMLSRQGRCRVFDASADGYVRSEGGGVFLLKDYDLAVADGNPILAVVVHTAVNTDGRKSGITVPSHMAQAALLTNAYRNAGIDPAQVDYIEAHGTGTAVGDPIETRALGIALGQFRARSNALPIGSVKGNVGHLEAASGIAGLLKAVYCVRHRQIPAHVGMDIPNPQIRFEDWNLDVVTANRTLRPNGRLIVGINSFGFGGANAHVILESYANPENKRPALPKAHTLPIVVSARDTVALRVAAGELGEFIAAQPQSSLYDIAYQSVFGRERHPHCAVLFGKTPETIAAHLLAFAKDAPDQANVEHGTALPTPVGAAFVYSGNGSQWAGMGALLLADPIFRATIREIDTLFARYANYSLEAELAGRNGADRYEFTEFAQPALFALQVGITAMLRHRGLNPVAVVGHSVGEVAAAWASGALSLAAAVSVIHHRSALQATTKGAGRMSAVNVGAQRIQELLAELNLAKRLSLAGINSNHGVTIAGGAQDLDQLERALTERDIRFKRLELDYAFHSPAMDDLYSEIRRALAHLEPDDTLIPLHSTVTGKRVPGKSLDAEYWWHNVREPVMFEPAVKGMVDAGINIFVEIGPHGVLRRYVQECLADAGIEGRVITTGARSDDAPRRIYSAAAQALIAGAQVNWQGLLPWQGRFIALPNYPWQRERHWHSVSGASTGLLHHTRTHPLLGSALNQAELTWEGTLDTLSNPVLGDHIVGDTAVFPGTGYAELALAAAIRWQAESGAEIEDLEILAPLLLAEEPSRAVRCALDPRDGQLTIKSREYPAGGVWTLQAVARVLRDATALRLSRTLDELPTRQPDFTARSHALLTVGAGLDYGPAFQAIEHGWIDGSAVLAVFKLPASVKAEIEQHHLHPALLDNAFQLIIQLMRDEIAGYQGLTFVPTRIGHLSYRGGMGPPKYARARILTRAPHSICGEFEIFDETRQPIALLEDVRFRSIRLQRNSAEQLRYLEYRAVPRPLGATEFSDHKLPEKPLDAALAACFSDPQIGRAQNQYAGEVDPLLDALCGSFIVEALAGESPSGHVPAATIYRQQLLDFAQADGLLEAARAGDSTQEAQDIWNGLISDYPDHFHITHAVGCVGTHLPMLWDGQATLADIWPSQISPPALLRQVLGTELTSRIGICLRVQLAAAIRTLPEGRRMRLAEVSAGPPALASILCKRLDFDRADYTFFSTEASGLDQARRLQERFPALDLCLLDEATAAGNRQLVIVTLDFCALGEAVRAVEAARSLLAPGGTLILVGPQPATWMDFVFGSNSGWWSDVPGSAPLAAVQPAQFWKQRLRDMGLVQPHTFMHSKDALSGAYLLVARRAATLALRAAETVQAHHWLLLADAFGYSARLAAALRECLVARGDQVSSAPPGNSATLATALREAGELHGIVDLTALRDDADSISALDLFECQSQRCTRAASLLRACEAAKITAPCHFVTLRAAAHLLPGRARSAADRAALVDAPLAGFVRTLMNEAVSGGVRLIDLESAAADVKVIAAALARELRAQDGEGEVILTAAGERYAPRLGAARVLQDAEPAGADVNETHNVRLGFTIPGQLRNLSWEAIPRNAPRGDQIEVAIRATGLNFRDVMYALGLLSDEAVEKGFAGPSLGLEFSGLVLNVGPDVSDFRPGDAVVGFAPSSFGNRLMTRAAALSHIPAGMSFEAAATTPSTFFTAYYALHHLASLQPGETVLIHGAAGGVGIAAIQIAKWCGAEIYATAGSDEKRNFLRLLGVEHIFDSRNLKFSDQILAVTGGQGVDVVLNSLAGEAINRNFRVLKPFGRFLELGKRDFYENTRIGLRPFRNNISYFGIDADQLMSERPELTRRLFGEVLALFNERLLFPLPYQAFAADEVIDAFRHMQQARQIGKIVVTYDDGVPDTVPPKSTKKPRLELSAEASFLVTGGLSGFGLRTAEWLADRGARHLVLFGRRGPGAEEAQTVLARLERRGVKVLARSCDATDRPALAELLEEVSRRMPPLRGIVHAAMVIDDGLIRDMNTAQIRRVLAPKILGALYLDELTRGMALDFFLFYSSATTLFGNPGQGNYVAANAALEALARARRAEGLPATCVLWGAIDDVGFLARNQKIKDALQGRMGGSALSSGLALDTLENIILADQSGIGVLEFEWRSLARFLPSASSPKFSDIGRGLTESDGDDEGGVDLQRLLRELPEDELLKTVIDMLKVEIGEILRFTPDKIDSNRSLPEMGLDSLMAVELAVAVESRFGVRLPVMALSESPNSAKLAAWIIERLRSEESSAAPDHAGETKAQIERIASQHASDMTPEELERIAANLNGSDDEGAGRRMIN